MKYKDREPQETVRIIKDILLKNRILTTEKWLEGAKGLYSVIISIEKTKFCSNGKGRTKEYALASGYGELMERLQNMAFFYINTDILYFDQQYWDLNESIVMSLNEVEEKIRKWLKRCGGESVSNAISDSISVLYGRNLEKGIRCEKFCELNGEDFFEIPYMIAGYYYGTNGMVAGNSKEEALVQGISEILERFVVTEIIREKVSPPRFSKDELKEYDFINTYIETIENGERYKVELVDLSLGKKIPAVGLILYDTLELAYFVKIAVSPSVQVAMERCFTELMQGKHISKFTGKTSFEKDCNNVNEAENILSIFETGEGIYPQELFEKTPSYEKYLKRYEFESQGQMLDELTNLIEELGYKIFYKDNTISDIFSYHIIIPGMSEICDLNDIYILKRNVQFQKVCNAIRYEIDDFSDKDYQMVREYLENSWYSPNSTMSVFYLNKSLEKKAFVNHISLYLFKAMLYLHEKNYGKAAANIKEYTALLSDKTTKPYKYYRCMAAYLDFMEKGMERQKTENILEKYFPNKLVADIRNDLSKKNFAGIMPLKCFNKCSSCQYNGNCQRNDEQRIYRVIRNNWKTQD